MTKADRDALRFPRPREVAGFEDAFARGVLPVVPERPPASASTALSPSAAAMSKSSWMKLGISLALLLVYTKLVTPRIELPLDIDFWPVPLLGFGWFFLAIFLRRQVATRTLQETLRGYATRPVVFATYSSTFNPTWFETDRRIPWSFSGVWVLTPKFVVVSVPNREVDPPGYYPSPHRPDHWELWTGDVWSGTYQPGEATPAV